MDILKEVTLHTLAQLADGPGREALSGCRQLGVRLLDADPHLQEGEFQEWTREQAKNDPCCQRYQRLVTLCGGRDGAVLLNLCLATLVYPQVRSALAEEGIHITPEFAASIEGEEGPDYWGQKRMAEKAEKILIREKGEQPFFRCSFAADERILDYLMGGNDLDKRLREREVRYLGESTYEKPFGREEYAKRMAAVLLRRDGTLLQLAGEHRMGKRFLLRQACKIAKCGLLFVDYRTICNQPLQEQKLLGRLIAREAELGETGCCFYHLDAESCPGPGGVKPFLANLLEPVKGLGFPVCICTDGAIELIPLAEEYIEKIEIPSYDRRERIALWEGYAAAEGMKSRLDWQTAGSKFKLSPGEIAQAARRLACQERHGAVLTDRDVARACEEVLPPPSQGSIKRIRVSYTLEDLKLPAEQKQTLYNICAHVTQRHKVYDEWGMEKRYAYGRNISALFVGPPGTGKTMAVQVMSDMLDIPLYRIDLSQVVDKYIGETEKKLEEIFNIAEKSNTILFFDEADSIFGKRSEVNDAKDKYANTEVSYILQRIEQYDGIVILATNYKKNIDEAFMRRMRYLVEFQLPNEALRREIWESCFTSQVPLQEIDFDFLARQFEFSGGSIKNIVLNAVFLAADRQEQVTMKHILDSIRTENYKLGKPMLRQDMAEYGFLF